MSEERQFPLLGGVGSVPWWVAEQAYMVYASKYGDSQSLERLAERGGFGIEEMDKFFPEWREKASLIEQLQSRLTTAEKEVERLSRWSDYFAWEREFEKVDSSLTTAAATIERLEDTLRIVATKHNLLKGLLGYPPCRCKPGQLCMKHAAKDILAEIEQSLPLSRKGSHA